MGKIGLINMGKHEIFYLLRALFVCLALCFPISSYAGFYLECTPEGAAVQNIPVGNIVINSDAVNGVIWSSPSQSVKLSCLGGSAGGNALVGLFKTIDKLNIPGIEWRVEVFGQDCAVPNNGTLHIGCYSSIVPKKGEKIDTIVGYKVKLMKSGNVAASKTPYVINNTTMRLTSEWALPEYFKTNITGSIQIVQATCKLSVGDVNRVLTLPTIGVGALPGVGSKAGSLIFKLSAYQCPPELRSAKVTFSGAQDSINNTLFSNNTGSGFAEGVAIHLGSMSDNKTIAANGVNNERVVNINSGFFELPLFVEYMRTGAIKAGTVKSDITFDIAYN